MPRKNAKLSTLAIPSGWIGEVRDALLEWRFSTSITPDEFDILTATYVDREHPRVAAANIANKRIDAFNNRGRRT